MNIKEIIDNIWIESDVQKNTYTLDNALRDVNSRIRRLIGRARRISSREPISAGETTSEIFTVVAGDNTFARTIENIPIYKVQFKRNGAVKWCTLKEDQFRGKSCCDDGCCELKYFANEKQIFIEDGKDGELKVTYASGVFVPYTLSDYSNEVAERWIPEEFQDLIWLYPAYRQALMYKTSKMDALEIEIMELQSAFDMHYKRNSSINQQVLTDEPLNNR